MIAQELVKDIQAMGLPAIEAGPGSSPQIGDGVIRGYIVSMEGAARATSSSAWLSDLALEQQRWIRS